MEKSIRVSQFIKVIERLPSDEPKVRLGIWYTTQNQHWLGWLDNYNTVGAYGRKPGMNRDAKFAYNHVVCPELLLYLIKAINIPPDLIELAEQAYQSGMTEMEKSGKIRKIVSWSIIYVTIWGDQTTKGLFDPNENDLDVRIFLKFKSLLNFLHKSR